MNIFLCTLSAIFDRHVIEYRYTYENEKDTITGYFSGEAPAKYLIKKLYQDRRSFFDKYIILSTNECKSEIKYKDGVIRNNDNKRSIDISKEIKTSEDYLVKCIKDEITHLSFSNTDADDYIASLRDKFTFINTDNPRETSLLTRIIDDTTKDTSVNIYTDLTGGSRVQSMYAIMVLAWLETLGFNVSKVVYANINKASSYGLPYVLGSIDDITSTYQMIQGVIANAKIQDENYTGNRFEQEHLSHTVFNTEPLDDEQIRNIKLGNLSPIYGGNEPYIFFSYAHKNTLPGQALLKHITDHNFRVWYDLGIEAGEKWEKRLYNQMNNCAYALILLSNEYLYHSTYCVKEIEYLLKTKGMDSLLIINLDNSSLEDIPAKFPKLREHFDEIQHVVYNPFKTDITYAKILSHLSNIASDCISTNEDANEETS